MNQYLLGLDAGTTSVKGILVDPFGIVKAIAVQEYQLQTPQADYCELDPVVYWDSACQVIRTLLNKGKIPSLQVKAMAISSQGETIIPVDQHGCALDKAVVWLDNRSVQEAREIEECFGSSLLLQKTGLPETLPMWPATRLLWWRKHKPDLWKKTRYFLLVEDYLLHHLTGKWVTNASMLSSTLYFDIVQKKYWQEMLDFLQTKEDRFPAIVTSGQIIGTILPEAAVRTGLAVDTLVVAGGYDHPVGAVGAGNIKPGMVTETTGASMAMVATTNQPLLEPAIHLPCQCHVVPDAYFLMPYGQTAGMVLRWFRDTFFQQEMANAVNGQDPYELMTALAAAIPAGSDGLIALPHLMGAGSPEFDPSAKGVFYGISLGTGRGHFIRSILEAVACMIRANLETLVAAGVPVHGIRALGGGAKSALWNQIKADVTSLPILTLENPETPSLGAAILAGVGAGVFPSLQTACDRMVRIKTKYEPDPVNQPVYQTLYQSYRHLYECIKPLRSQTD